jgi:Spy/CpxP family protein refolding chaperone
MKTLKPMILATALLFGGLAVANPQHKNKGARNPLMRALHQLDLSDQQRQDVKQIMKSSKSQRKNLAKQLAQGKTKMAALLDTDKQDGDAIEALATEQSQLMKQLILYKADVFTQVRAILSQEQRAKLAKMRAKRERIQGIMLEE